jgi:hypothetical protein
MNTINRGFPVLFLSMPLQHMAREEVPRYTFLTSALNGIKWSPSYTGYFTHSPLERTLVPIE